MLMGWSSVTVVVVKTATREVGGRWELACPAIPPLFHRASVSVFAMCVRRVMRINTIPVKPSSARNPCVKRSERTNAWNEGCVQNDLGRMVKLQKYEKNDLLKREDQSTLNNNPNDGEQADPC